MDPNTQPFRYTIIYMWAFISITVNDESTDKMSDVNNIKVEFSFSSD
jgi:hypothetical protein